MEKLVQKPKTKRFPLIEKKVFGPILKKKENKKERVTESLHLTVKIARRSNDNMTDWSQKLCITKITAEITTKRL